MYPAKHDIQAYQGDTFDYPIWYRAAGMLVDLTGRAAQMQVRKHHDSDPILDFSTVDGTILLMDDVVSTLEDEGETANLQILGDVITAAGDYIYDLNTVALDGTVETLMYGAFRITREVTHA